MPDPAPRRPAVVAAASWLLMVAGCISVVQQAHGAHYFASVLLAARTEPSLRDPRLLPFLAVALAALVAGLISVAVGVMVWRRRLEGVIVVVGGTVGLALASRTDLAAGAGPWAALGVVITVLLLTPWSLRWLRGLDLPLRPGIAPRPRSVLVGAVAGAVGGLAYLIEEAHRVQSLRDMGPPPPSPWPTLTLDYVTYLQSSTVMMLVSPVLPLLAWAALRGSAAARLAVVVSAGFHIGIQLVLPVLGGYFAAPEGAVDLLTSLTLLSGEAIALVLLTLPATNAWYRDRSVTEPVGETREPGQLAGQASA